MNKPTIVYHADWGSKPSKRWCAKATLGVDGRYTASGPTPVGEPTLLLKNLRDEAREAGTVFAGFDFPIGVPRDRPSPCDVSRQRSSESTTHLTRLDARTLPWFSVPL